MYWNHKEISEKFWLGTTFWEKRKNIPGKFYEFLKEIFEKFLWGRSWKFKNFWKFLDNRNVLGEL